MKHLTLILSIFLLAGCNSQKRTTRRAERKLDKSIRLDQNVFARECAIDFNPIDSIHERIVYKPGVVKYDTVQDVRYRTVNDTVYATEYVTITKHIRDTIDLTRHEALVNKAAQDTMKRYYEQLLSEEQAKNDKLIAKNASLKKERNYWRMAAIILGLYTLARWILSKYLPFKLP